jgi:hypothetical protein
MRTGLLSEKSIDPPSATQPDLNVVVKKALADADDIFRANHFLFP